MEIAFIILWKEKIKDKTDLTDKIKDMLKQVFEAVTDDSFLYTFNEKHSYSFNYSLSEKDDKAYLKITNKESDTIAAKALSSIRDILSKGEHRNDFYIICSYDEASLSYCCRLMKPMGIFERHLRELMYLITIKAFGVDWVKKTIPKDINDEVEKNIKQKTKNTNPEKKIETALEYFTYDNIKNFLFDDRYIGISPETLLENELSDDKLKSLSKEDIIAIISNNRKCSLWNKLLADIKGINKETLDKIRTHRNDVMHQHTLSEDSFNTILNEVKTADKIISQAITDIESKIYTEEERKIFQKSTAYALYETLSALQSSLPDPSPSAAKIATMLSALQSSRPDYSQNLLNITRSFISVLEEEKKNRISGKLQSDNEQDEDNTK